MPDELLDVDVGGFDNDPWQDADPDLDTPPDAPAPVDGRKIHSAQSFAEHVRWDGSAYAIRLGPGRFALPDVDVVSGKLSNAPVQVGLSCTCMHVLPSVLHI